MINQPQNDAEVGELEIVVDEPEPPISEVEARHYYTTAESGTSKFNIERRIEAGYFFNEQIPAAVEKIWRERNQPIIYTNKIDCAINGVLGVYDAAQSDPKCEARDPSQQDSADIATKVLRYLNDRADTRSVKMKLSKDYFIYGSCAIIVGEGAYTGTDRIAVRHVPWSDFFYDPTSKEQDYSDASFMGISMMLHRGEAKRLYPEKAEMFDGCFATLPGWMDEANQQLWLDKKDQKVRIVELYFKHTDGQWHKVTYCAGGFIDFGISPFMDDDGNRICPILAASFEINPDTRERFGPIMALRPLQDEYNARRGVLLNEAQNHRIRITEQGLNAKDKKTAQAEAKKADGVLPWGTDMVSVPDIAAGQAQLLAKTEADFDRRTPSSTVLSAMRGQDSGRARQILQNAGLTEWSRAFLHLEKLEERMNRHLWFGAKQFMTTKQWIRTTGEARAADYLEINVPVGVNMVPQTDAQGAPVMDPTTGAPAMKAVPVLEKALATMDVDIILDSVPDTVSLQQEANEQILKYAEGMQLSITDPQFRLVMELFLTVDRTRQLERYDAGMARMQEQAAPMQQMQQQMQQMQQQLEHLRVQAEAQKDLAHANKLNAEADYTKVETALVMSAPQHPMMHQQSAPELRPPHPMMPQPGASGFPN
ncbi:MULTISPECIES: hypothetical protein [Sphingomonas]|uniref:portal protein n=1 Tax=Sphingomonas TaxID=13687 RepID=UPI000DEEFE6F|nr:MULTISPECIES: hypothetical protein [Sphingomonas]